MKNKNMPNEQIESKFDDSFSADDSQAKEKENTTKATKDELDNLKAEIQPSPENNDDGKNIGQSPTSLGNSILEHQQKKQEAGEKKQEAEKKNIEGSMRIEQIQKQINENIENARKIFLVDHNITGYFEFLEKETKPLLQQYLDKNPEAQKVLLEKLAKQKPKTNDKDGKEIPLTEQLWANKIILDSNNPFEMGVFTYLNFSKQIERYKTFAKNKEIKKEIADALQKHENIFDGVHERTYYGQYLASCTDQAEIDRLKKEQADVDAFRTQMTGQKVESDSPSMTMFSTVEQTMKITSTPEQIQKVQETVSVIGTPTTKPEMENGQVKLHLFDTRTQQNYTVYITPEGKIMLQDIATKEKVELKEPTPKEAVDMQDAVFHRALIYTAFSSVNVGMDEFKILFPTNNPKTIQSFYIALKANSNLEPEMALWMICHYYQRATRNEFAGEPRLASLYLENNTAETGIHDMTDFLIRLDIVNLTADKGPAGTSGGSSPYAFDFGNLESLVKSLSTSDPKENLIQYFARRGMDKHEKKGKEILPQDPKTPLPSKNDVASLQPAGQAEPVPVKKG